MFKIKTNLFKPTRLVFNGAEAAPNIESEMRMAATPAKVEAMSLK